MSMKSENLTREGTSEQQQELQNVFRSQKSSMGEKRTSKGWLGLALLGLTGGAAVALTVVAAPFVAPALRKVCLPYVPASTQQVQNVMTALRATPGRTLVDLGSGDGRLVVAASQHLRVHATGVELNPWLVLFSRYSAWRAGQSSTTNFLTADLWTLNLKRYDNVVIFGVEEMMAELEQKLLRELPPSGNVVACRFPLPSWTPSATIGSGIDTVWLYNKPGTAHGSSAQHASTTAHCFGTEAPHFSSVNKMIFATELF